LTDATPAQGSADGGTGGLVVFSGGPRAGRGALAAHVLLQAAATSSVGTIEAVVRGPLNGVDQFIDEHFYDDGAAARWRSIVNVPSLDLLYVRELLGFDAADLVVTAAARRRTRFMTTVCTNDAPAVILRLRAMGVDTWQTAAALRLVLQTARIRRLCPYCRTPVAPPSLVFERHEMSPPAAVCRPAGCLHCGNSGYIGWIIIAERLPITAALRQNWSIRVLDHNPCPPLRHSGRRCGAEPAGEPRHHRSQRQPAVQCQRTGPVQADVTRFTAALPC
jgi:general secretion pathway protein E